MAKDVIAPKRKKLSDLFVTGSEVVFEDGSDDPPKVWVQKLTPQETQEAADKARPEKMKILAIKRLDDDDPVKLRYVDEVDSSFDSKDDFISFIISEKLEKASVSAQEEVASRDEWSKDDFLEGLQDAWSGELKETFLKDSEDEEAKRVYDLLSKYTDQVTEEIKRADRDLRNEIDHLDEDELRRRCVRKLIDIYSDEALLKTFRKWQLYLAVRDPDRHAKRYFSSLEEVDSLQAPVLERLQNEYAELTVEGFEGKD